MNGRMKARGDRLSRGGRPATDATVLLVGTYAFFATLAVLGAFALGRDPFVTRSVLGLEGHVAALASVGMGAVAATATIVVSRLAVRASAWGRALHADLRPAVSGASDRGILVMALASGIGEELVFRGLLVPLVGIVLSSLAFGLLHQVRGRARWAWAAWAALTGAVFGAIFVLTGSLAGPILAHVGINFVNLRHLRDHGPGAA
jgi:membrane protease YdiL (CAAX protease family)